MSTYRFAQILFGLLVHLLPAAPLIAQDFLPRTGALEEEGMSWSYCVRELQSGDLLYAHDPDRLMTPGSNVKVLTTAAAMDLLGPEFRYETIVGLKGDAKGNGMWDGDLIVVGSGDPTLGSKLWDQRPVGDELFRSPLEALASRQINSIEGDLVIYTGTFEDRSHHPSWPWSDLANYFGIGGRALNFHDNSYTIFLGRSRKRGARVHVLKTDPPVPYAFDSRVIIGPSGSGDQAWIFGAPWDDHRVIRGSIPPGTTAFSIEGSVGMPEEWFGALFRRALEAQGIELKGEVLTRSGFPETPYAAIHRWISPEMKEIVERTNRKSSNLYAEALLMTIGKAKGARSTMDEGIKVLEHYIEERMGITNGWYIVDGSGLSPENALSTGMMTEFLSKYFHNGERTDRIDSFLPKTGEEGTVIHFGLNGGAAWLKSGTLGQSRAYSGIVRRLDGSYVALSIMVNHYGEHSDVAYRFCNDFIQNIILTSE